MIQKLPSLNVGQKVCDKCRKKISQIVSKPEPALDLDESESQSSQTS